MNSCCRWYIAAAARPGRRGNSHGLDFAFRGRSGPNPVERAGRHFGGRRDRDRRPTALRRRFHSPRRHANRQDSVALTRCSGYWIGGNGAGLWDQATTANFSDASGSIPPIATTFDLAAQATSVTTFSDFAGDGQTPVATYNVTVAAAGVSPAADVSNSTIVFTNGATYTFANETGGTAGISGGFAVDVQGSGTVVFNSPNTYSGGTTITGGTLQLGNAGALGSGPLTIDGGTLDVHGLSTAPIGGLSGTGGTISSGSTKVNATLQIKQTVDGTYAGNITNGATRPLELSLVAGSTAALTLTGALTYTGPTEIDGGTLVVAGGLTGTSTVDIDDGATLAAAGTISHMVTLGVGFDGRNAEEFGNTQPRQ